MRVTPRTVLVTESHPDNLGDLILCQLFMSNLQPLKYYKNNRDISSRIDNFEINLIAAIVIGMFSLFYFYLVGSVDGESV